MEIVLAFCALMLGIVCAFSIAGGLIAGWLLPKTLEWIGENTADILGKFGG